LNWPRAVVMAMVGGCAVGCGPFLGARQPEDLRVVRFTLLPPNSQQEALGGTRPAQLVAVRIEGGQLLGTDVGSPVDPRTPQRLSLGISRSHAVVLFVQTPRGNTATLGQLVGRVLWSDGRGGLTSTLPAGDGDVDLGELSFTVGSPSTLADNTLLVPDESNPLARMDRNGDGQPDLTDDDDDGDGILDANDPDVDGDNLADLDQVLGALPDRNGSEDGDGVPDDLE
jgi:hypothetical protein